MIKQDAIKRFRDACGEGRQLRYPYQFDISVFEVDDEMGRIRVEKNQRPMLLDSSVSFRIKIFLSVDSIGDGIGSGVVVFQLSEKEYSELKDLYCDVVGVEARRVGAEMAERKKIIISVAISAIGSLMSFLYIHAVIAGSFQMQVLASISIGCAVFMFCRGLMYFGSGDNNYPVGDGEGICF